MNNTAPPGGDARRPHFDEVVQLIKTHVKFARDNPGMVRKVARRMGADTDSILAVIIADELFGEFDLSPRPCDKPSVRLLT